MFLPWFARNFTGARYEVGQYEKVVEVIEVLREDRCPFFGEEKDMAEANKELDLFYDALKPTGTIKANQTAVEHYCQAWKLAFKKRSCLQLRGYEVKMIKYFNEIIGGADHVHLPELQSMARVVSGDVINIARLVKTPGQWSPKKALAQNSAKLNRLKGQVFGDKEPTPDVVAAARKKTPEKYGQYQQALKDYKHVATLRMIEMFDVNGWHTVIDSATLHETLKNEGIEEFLPETFRGRVGVQQSGYPLTFYTYSGLELESPPMNEVVMNLDYGQEEAGKNYKTHPITDGTYYCEMKAVAGETKTKIYTLEYKRRARRQKYAGIAKFGQVIDDVRVKMIEHLESEDRDTWVLATMCLFMDNTCARIGNVTSTKGKKKTYGVTTLLTKKHAKVYDDRVVISYRGKHDQPQKHTLALYRTKNGRPENSIEYAIAQKLVLLINEGNEQIFTHEDGKAFKPQSVNEYFRATEPTEGLPEGGAGSPCTVHNLRNYHATRMFKEFSRVFAAKRRKVEYTDLLASYQGRAKTKTRSGTTGIIEKIAKKLGNTPAICRKAYIDPREQLLYFDNFGYRPSDGLIRDLFVDETVDTYGLSGRPTSRKRFIFDDNRGKISDLRRKRTA
jgi:DNA topoisomerase IB